MKATRIPVFTLSSPPQPHPAFIEGKKKEKNIAENVNENTYFFYLCLSVSVVSACISSGAQSPLPVFSLLMYLSICTFPPPRSSCSVSFSQFQNSLCLSLSLFSLCWDRVLRPDSVACPACVVSFRYYIEFNDNDII